MCALANRKIIARDECAGVRATSNLRAARSCHGEKLTSSSRRRALYMLGDTREIIDGCDKIDDRKEERKKHATYFVRSTQKRACMVGCMLLLLHIFYCTGGQLRVRFCSQTMYTGVTNTKRQFVAINYPKMPPFFNIFINNSIGFVFAVIFV